MSGEALTGARVVLTGATGLVGRALVPALLQSGAELTLLTRDPDRARLGPAVAGDASVEMARWDPGSEPAPVGALEGRDACVNLAGEPIAQRWTARAKREIQDSRVLGTRNLLEGLRMAGEGRPRTLVSSSSVGYYGSHGEEPLDEETPPGNDFLARLCVAWEREAAAATELGVRVVEVRTGIVLDATGGALAKLLPPFRLGLGGPVAGGSQYMSWVHPDDLVGLILTALEREEWSGPLNATAPEPVSNREFSKTLARLLARPAITPVPGIALRLLYGEVAETITSGARVVPAKALVLGYEFVQPSLAGALRAALAAELEPARR